MGWKMSRIRTSIMGLLREPDDGAQDVALLEHIRDEMRDCLEQFSLDQAAHAGLWRRLHNAADMQTLWYLRSDLMHHLSHVCGETQARTVLNNITALFRGHLPAALFESARRRPR